MAVHFKLKLCNKVIKMSTMHFKISKAMTKPWEIRFMRLSRFSFGYVLVDLKMVINLSFYTCVSTHLWIICNVTNFSWNQVANQYSFSKHEVTTMEVQKPVWGSWTFSPKVLEVSVKPKLANVFTVSPLEPIFCLSDSSLWFIPLPKCMGSDWLIKEKWHQPTFTERSVCDEHYSTCHNLC